jgi:hypothetical protein
MNHLHEQKLKDALELNPSWNVDIDFLRNIIDVYSCFRPCL